MCNQFNFLNQNMRIQSGKMEQKIHFENKIKEVVYNSLSLHLKHCVEMLLTKTK